MGRSEGAIRSKLVLSPLAVTLPAQRSFRAICSSRISRTVSGMMTLPLLRKNASISRHGVAGEVEGDEEALRPVGARHHGLEGVDVRPARLVLLLHLDGIPVVHEVELAGVLRRASSARPTTGEDAAVDAHVADLRLVRDAAEGDDGPVLELERRDACEAAASVHGRSRTTKPRPTCQSFSSSRRPHTSRRRFAMTRQAVGEMSMPIHWRPRFWAATSAVPQPQKASSTMSFSLLLALMMRSRRASGFCVG